MPTFGEKLKAERERRNTPLSDVAARTRIGLRYLEALERDDLDELPGPRGFGKLYIRAYADMLGFDPAPLIREYDDVVHQRLREADPSEGEPAPPRLRRVRYVPPPRAGGVRDAGGDDPDEDAPDAPDSDDAELPALLDVEEPATEVPVAVDRSATRRRQLVAIGGVALLAIAIAWLLRDDPGATDRLIGDRDPAAATATPIAPEAEAEEPAVATPVELAPVEIADEIESDVAPEPPVAPSSTLAVTGSALGTGVRDLRIVGERATFAEGDRASFLTRVRGGVVGERIRHVWLREGRVVQGIPLTLGGGNWRTYSTKTLWGTGAWSVEARDGEGRVLASAAFEVVPPRRGRR